MNYDPNKPTELKEWVPVDMGRHMKLAGDVYNHPRKPIIRDGDDVLTTALVAFDPTTQRCRTHSGTVYQLHAPHSTGAERFWSILQSLNLPKEV